MDDLIWIVAVMILAFLIGGVGLGKMLRHSRKMDALWRWMLFLFVCQTVALASKGMLSGMCPVKGLSDVLFFMGWALNACYLFLGRMYRMSVLGIFTAPAIALVMACAWLTHGSPLPPLGSNWVTWHITLAMLAYGLFGLAAVAGLVFLIQDGYLKGHRVSGVSSVLPPVRTLQFGMVRLMTTGFLLLLLSQVFGYTSGMSIPPGKGVTVLVISVAYLLLLCVHFFRGMPGRILALWTVGLYVLALAIFLVLK